MISLAPLRRFMAEHGFTEEFIYQSAGIDRNTFNKIMKGQSITPGNIDLLCKTFNLQPSDIIEWTDTEIKGHWVYVEAK